MILSLFVVVAKGACSGAQSARVNKVNNEKKVAAAYDLWPQEAQSVKSSSEFVV